MKSRVILATLAALTLPWLAFAGASSQSLGGISLIEVAPRVITPNGDLLNDVVYFKFDDTISGLPLEGNIFDLNGAKVAHTTLDSTETAMLWDGKDDGGRVAPSGIYIYSFVLGTHQATGTVVVAR